MKIFKENNYYNRERIEIVASGKVARCHNIHRQIIVTKLFEWERIPAYGF